MPALSSVPPFRADHVGSLLRPRALTHGFRQLTAGEITPKDYAALQVAANILGQGFTSRLVSQIQIVASRQNQVEIAAFFQVANDRGTDQAAVARHKNPARMAQLRALRHPFTRELRRAVLRCVLHEPT